MQVLALTFFVTLAGTPAAPPAPSAATPAVGHAAPATHDASSKAGGVDVKAAIGKALEGAGMTPVSDKNYAARVLEPHRGKVLVVNFWASYCVPCLQEIPALQELAKENEQAVDVVFVSSDPPSQAPHALALLQRRKVYLTSFIVENDDPEPFIAMINAPDGGGLKGAVWGGEMPYTVIYNAAGHAIQKMPGAHSKADFQAAIDAAVKSQPQAATPAGKKQP